MAAWRKRDRHHQKKREATRVGKLLKLLKLSTHTEGKRKTCEATPIVLTDEPKNPVRTRDGLRPA